LDFVSLGESDRDPSPGAIQPAFRLSVQSIVVVVFCQFATGDADLPHPYNILVANRFTCITEWRC
jgi:hypothetical protein